MQTVFKVVWSSLFKVLSYMHEIKPWITSSHAHQVSEAFMWEKGLSKEKKKITYLTLRYSIPYWNPWQLQKKKPILIIFASCCKFIHLANFEILISKTCYGDLALTCLSQTITNSHLILPLFFCHFLEMFCITEQYKPCR